MLAPNVAFENGKVRYTPNAAITTFPYTETFEYTMNGGGTTSAVLDLRRPNNNWSTYDLLDFALTTDQMVALNSNQIGALTTAEIDAAMSGADANPCDLRSLWKSNSVSPPKITRPITA